MKISPKLPPKVFEREAKKILRRLAQKGASLIWDGNNHYLLQTTRAKKPVMTLEQDIVLALQNHDLITPTEQHQLKISQAGALWLKRAQTKNSDNPFQKQHQNTITKTNALGESYYINVKNNPLLWLHKRRSDDGQSLISENQMEAGFQLQHDFLRSRQNPKMTVDLSQPKAAHHLQHYDGIPLSEVALLARQRVQKALTMLGPGLADIALEVCCYMQGLEVAEQHLGWPKRAGKIVLGIALNRLALFYGIIRPSR